MKNPILLIGNDINNMSKGQSWRDLLNDIVTFCLPDGCIQLDERKPFPLLYEEIFLTAIRQAHIREVELKSFIAKKTLKIEQNDIHAAIRNLAPAHILTTNYEFTLEGEIPLQSDGLILERIFSIFRKYKIGNTNYWHIHGDCLNPLSINLGFEHYGGQLQQMRNYVVSGTTYTSPQAPRKSLVQRISQHLPVTEDSWLDLFFTRDIHIFGLSLDFVETDLWWLLTYRARQKFQKNTIPVSNALYYYIPSELAPGAKFKLEMLVANDVKVIEITATDKRTYYEEVLRKISKL
ncbi:hypothetical protein [Chitinophaga ginsengisoli]|uniref:SIR2-like protein n=1 Tax=Chitinophaga ginsengisoli TaxID=363837 RepID=A0A2P8GNV1_9BACT|nr:hypothetical protein [Chitinophaga ginsengisoli]PSL35636.1 hypothetical protein CLV42_101398 [Chitinophaga ginsengisoli]